MDFIYRIKPTTDESPPWVGISFILPVDSDMLSEKLKLAYPQCRTLRERKHQATLDFFVAELRQMQSKDLSPFTTANFSGSDIAAPSHGNTKPYSYTLSDTSRPQTVSRYSSPSVPGSEDSPRPTQRAKPVSIGINPHVQRAITPTKNSQQFVWSAHDGKSMRPKTKRKMTSQERSAYKETRKRGACESCRRQKGKVFTVTFLYQFLKADS
jgi:hypothetical protein